MAVKLIGLTQTKRRLREISRKADKIASEEVETAGREVYAIARASAPVDEGNLEKSIGLEITHSLTEHRAEIYIDEEAYGGMRNKVPRTVAEYALYAHEQITPYGTKNLGPKSQKKQEAAEPGIIVGGGFMDRAELSVKEGNPVNNKPSLAKRIQNGIRKFMGLFRR